MAFQVESFAFRPVGRPPKYPWGEWADGNVWRAYKHVDFDCTPYGFAMCVYQAARRRGMQAQVTVDNERATVTFQMMARS